MSYRDVNILHFRTPYSLLRVPEYMKFFDSQSIGSLYRLLSSKIYRRGTERLKFYREGTSITELAKRYSNGDLCAYLSEDEISESLMLSTRQIENLRKKLIDLKLIKAQKLKTPSGEVGYIYQLGTVITLKDDDGYTVGEEIEGHYIDQWYTWANSKDDNPELYAAFRYYLAEMLGSDGKKAQSQEDLRKIFPEITKNFSEILGRSAPTKYAPRQKKPQVKNPPIEVITIEDINSKELPQSGGLFGSSVDQEFINLKFEEFKGRIKSKRTNISNISKEFRSTISAGVPKEMATQALLDTVSAENRFEALPLFSKNLEVEHKTPLDRLTWLWLSLREDVTGAPLPSNGKVKLFEQTRTAMQQILDKYSLEQVIWTIREAAKSEKDRLSLVNTPFSIHSFVANKSAQYVTYQQDLKVYKAKIAAQEASEKVKEEERAKFLEEASKSVVESTKTQEQDVNTVEYWQGKIASASGNVGLIQYYNSKIAEIQRKELLT